MVNLLHGDCLDILKTLPADSVDSLVTDPPAGISFMGKNWDKSDGFIPSMTEIFQECLRVMKPGAHGLVWALPRTSHWTATALENAGFDVRDVITHLFGSGFPKSHDISKGIDKAVGIERPSTPLVRCDGKIQNNKEGGGWKQSSEKYVHHPVFDGSTPAAKKWAGWGTALKPASEHWILVRKPLSEKTVAANVLKHGCGGLNIDACRINGKPRTTHSDGNFQSKTKNTEVFGRWGLGYKCPEPQGRFPANLVLSCDCVDACTEGCAVAELDRQTKDTRAGKPSGSATCPVKRSCVPGLDQSNRKLKRIKTYETGEEVSGASRFFYCAKVSSSERNAGLEGMQKEPHPGENLGRFPANLVLSHSPYCTDDQCDIECAVEMLDDQSGTLKSGASKSSYIQKASPNIAMSGKNYERRMQDRKADFGGASRFFYCAKASKSDKNAGLEGMPTKTWKDQGFRDNETTHLSPRAGANRSGKPVANHHPTVKSTKLMSYLIKLVTPPNGIVLDPFLGSGSTGVSAKREGFSFIGIEREEEYLEIAKRRIEHV